MCMYKVCIIGVSLLLSVGHVLSNLPRAASLTNTVSRKPTIIRVPSKR